MYVYMYACMHACIYIYIYMCVCVFQIYIHLNLNIYICDIVIKKSTLIIGTICGVIFVLYTQSIHPYAQLSR